LISAALPRPKINSKPGMTAKKMTDRVTAGTSTPAPGYESASSSFSSPAKRYAVLVPVLSLVLLAMALLAVVLICPMTPPSSMLVAHEEEPPDEYPR
jgi:hypothetical protein